MFVQPSVVITGLFFICVELCDSKPAAFTSGQLPHRHSQRQRREESVNKRVVEGGTLKSDRKTAFQ